MNGHSNKRQRQPALLGHHPTEYGKALGGHQHVHSQKTGSDCACLIRVHRSTVAVRRCCVGSFSIAIKCKRYISVIIVYVFACQVGTGTRMRVTVGMTDAVWVHLWEARKGAGLVSATAASTLPRLRRHQENTVLMQSHQS